MRALVRTIKVLVIMLVLSGLLEVVCSFTNRLTPTIQAPSRQHATLGPNLTFSGNASVLDSGCSFCRGLGSGSKAAISSIPDTFLTGLLCIVGGTVLVLAVLGLWL